MAKVSPTPRPGTLRHSTCAVLLFVFLCSSWSRRGATTKFGLAVAAGAENTNPTSNVIPPPPLLRRKGIQELTRTATEIHADWSSTHDKFEQQAEFELRERSKQSNYAQPAKVRVQDQRPPPPPPCRTECQREATDVSRTLGSREELQKSACQSDASGISIASPASHPTSRSSGSSPAISRQAQWLLRANGGSSTPLPITEPPQTSDHVSSLQYQQRPPPPPPPPPPPGPQLVGDSTFTEGRTMIQQRRQPTSPVSGPGFRALPEKGFTGSGLRPRDSHALTARNQIRDYKVEASYSGSMISRLRIIMSSISEFRLPRFLNRGGSFQKDEALAVLNLWNAADSGKQSRKGGFWMHIFRRPKGKSANLDHVSLLSGYRKQDSQIPHLLHDFVNRFKQQQGFEAALLSKEDRQKGALIGRKLAILDIAMLSFATLVIHELKLSNPIIPRSISELFSKTVWNFSSMFVGFKDTWAPYAMAAFYLSLKTRELVESFDVKPLGDELSASIQSEVQCGSLFLRLYKGKPVDRQITGHIQRAIRSQVKEKVAVARLRLYVFALLSTFLAISVSILGPLIKTSYECLIRLLSLPEMRVWPVQWQPLLSGMHQTLSESSRIWFLLLGKYLEDISNNALKAAFQLAVMTVLVVTAYIPRVEKLRKTKPAPYMDEEEFEAAQYHTRFTASLEDLGSSSGSRLCTLSELNAIEIGLERWRLLMPQDMADTNNISTAAFIRVLMYNVISGLMLATPIFILAYGKGVTMELPTSSLDLLLIFCVTHNLLQNAIRSVVVAREAEGYIAVFMSALKGSLKERLQEKESHPNLEIQAAMNPASGLVVKDLWAANSARRAWAVRGTSFQARNSEIVAVFGEGSAGKTRLLTTLAEAILEPPRETLSTNRVRGTISLSGIETNKWDKALLRRRLGLLLNDVHTLSAASKALSGMSIEEIIEPSSMRRSPEASRNAMILALKITGLYASLIPRLPSKLSTVVTAVEEDLRNQNLRPRCILLSPVEWSKLLLSRVLAQVIYDNDNPASSGDAIDRCLVGSVLILDDATAHFSDADEARLFVELRRTGAAIIIASNRWTIGRLVDKIIILKDGAVVETGAHNQLLGRGPQYSLYAAQWHAMATP